MADHFLQTVLVQNRAEAADRTFQEDLPVNPLSHINLTMRGVITAADTLTPLLDILNSFTTVGVMFRGQDVIRGSLADLAVMSAVITGCPPYGQKIQDAAAETWTLTVCIPFGRKLYDPEECFPAVKRGDLRLEIGIDTVVTNVDLVEIQFETVELLEGNPKQFLKYTTNQVTFASTGQEVTRLPIGNPLLGVLLFGTTIPTGAARTATWEQLRTKVDNVESLYARTNWDTLSGRIIRRIQGDLTLLSQHIHRYNGAAAAFANTLTPMRDTGILDSYGYLDFDPNKDNRYMLETAGRADVTIQRDSGVADLGRFIPLELVSVAAAA
jgi:hypothetical protein